ncbi:hypothetical protein ScPMuIL_000076 [Solemya velum]
MYLTRRLRIIFTEKHFGDVRMCKWLSVVAMFVVTIGITTVYGDFSKDPECSVSLGCFYDCSKSDDCTFLVSWADKGDGSIDFTIKSEVPASTNRWIAIGFSHDKRMGADSVTECVMEQNDVTGSTIGVYHSYNHGTEKYNYRLEYGQAQLGLTLINSSNNDGIFTCQFNQVKAPVDANDEIYDLENEYHLMFAQGIVDSIDTALKLRHSLNPTPMVSVVKMGFTTPGSHVSFGEVNNVARIHACLMILAWVFFASIGVVVSRYYKDVWSDEWLCGRAVWFQVHRILMMFVFCFCVAGFVLIFVEKQEWVTIDGTNFQKAHPYLGVAVMILAFMNPMLALFRCHPESRRRKLFNWTHWFIGISVHILAIITIFSGMTLEEAGIPFYVLYIMMAYVIYQFVFELLLEIHQCCLEGRFRGDAEFDTKNTGDSQFPDYRSERQDEDRLMKAALTFHVLIILGFTVAICVSIFVQL